MLLKFRLWLVITFDLREPVWFFQSLIPACFGSGYSSVRSAQGICNKEVFAFDILVISHDSTKNLLYSHQTSFPLTCFFSTAARGFCCHILNVTLQLIAELDARGAPLLRKSTHPRKFGNHVTDRPTDRPSVRTTGIPMFTLTLSSYFGSPGES